MLAIGKMRSVIGKCRFDFDVLKCEVQLQSPLPPKTSAYDRGAWQDAGAGGEADP